MIETRDGEASFRSAEKDDSSKEVNNVNVSCNIDDDTRTGEITNNNSNVNNNLNVRSNSSAGQMSRMNARFSNRNTISNSQNRQMEDSSRQPRPPRPPRPQNQLLRDLIRILILNRLFNRNRPPIRPPMPPRPRMDQRYEPWFETGY